MSSPSHAFSGAWNPAIADARFLEDRAAWPIDREWRVEDLLLVVVGAHLRAEATDRPLATRLVRLIGEWQAKRLDPEDVALVPLVCTDLWYLNDTALMRQPTIAIGEPGVNAATAYYANRLPRAYVVDDVCVIQCDPTFLDGSVCMWGADARGNEAGFEAFLSRYADDYLRSVHGI